MFIRRTKTRSAEGGKVYHSYRLVRSERSGERVRQRTLLNLGSDFAVATEHWAVLCSRIEQLLERQGVLVELECPEEVEREAQRIAMQLVQRGAEVAAGGTDLQTVDVESLELERPRTVGVEHVGLWAMERLGLGRLLEGLGFNGRQRAVAVGSIIGRMGQPGSERASWRWLCERSGLGELLEVDFEAMSLMRLYRVSDALMAHREAIEKHLFEQVTELFGLGHTVTLYDLTNTFFEGEAADQPKAQRGHSKEKRSDCALLTLGLVLDGSGFVRRSEVFAGRVDEDKTLEPMLKALHAPADALVVMDAGIATEDNVAWLRDNGYRYLVVSRQRTRRFDPERAIETRSHHKVHLHKVVDEDRGEVRLYCYSEERAKKEEGSPDASPSASIAEAPRGVVAAPHPQGGSTLSGSGSGGSRSAAAVPGSITPWTSSPTPTAARQWPSPGSTRPLPAPCSPIPVSTVYAPMSTTGIHRPCGALTPCSPISKPCSALSSPNSASAPSSTKPRTVPTVTSSSPSSRQTIRRRLAEHGENASWTTLRRILQGQHRVTASFRRKDGRTLHVRKATRAEQPQLKIYTALDLHPTPGGVTKLIV